MTWTRAIVFMNVCKHQWLHCNVQRQMYKGLERFTRLCDFNKRCSGNNCAYDYHWGPVLFLLLGMSFLNKELNVYQTLWLFSSSPSPKCDNVNQAHQIVREYCLCLIHGTSSGVKLCTTHYITYLQAGSSDMLAALWMCHQHTPEKRCTKNWNLIRNKNILVKWECSINSASCRQISWL